MRATASCLVVLLLYCSVDKAITDCNNCTEGGCGKDCGNSSEVEEITCSSSITLPTNHCDIIDNSRECVDNQPFIGTNINPPLPYWIKCCDSISCPYRNIDKLAAAKIIPKHTWIAVNAYIATLKLYWSLPQQIHVNGYKLAIAVNGNPAVARCMCFSASVLAYSVNVSLSAGTSLSVKITDLPYTASIGEDLTTTSFDVTIPSSCWHTEEASSDKCTAPFAPSAPQYLVIVNVVTVNGSTVMSINWEQPASYDTEITAYRIEADNTSCIIGAAGSCNVSSQTTCHYNVTLSAAQEYSIRVSASSCDIYSSIDEDCEYIDDNNNTCWGQPAEVTKDLSSSAANSNNPPVILIIVISSLSVLVTMVVVIVTILIITHTRLRKGVAGRYMSLLLDGDDYATRRVFVINAPQSSEEDLSLVRQLCHKLADNSVKPVNYEYSTFDRQHGPGKTGIYQWAENNFTECNMTLFVCNKSFCDAWNSDQNSLISASKRLLQGHMSHSEDVSQFGVILLRRCDEQYIPSLYLRSLQKFVVFQDDRCVIESLLDQMHT